MIYAMKALMVAGYILAAPGYVLLFLATCANDYLENKRQ